MAQTIKIKRSTTTSAPSALTAGELAYSSDTNKLFIGSPASGNAVTAIGGALYVEMLDHTAGTLTASSAVITDSNNKIDKLLVDNIRIGNTDNQIDTASGSLTIDPASDLVLKSGTIDLSTQATEFKLIDNSATGGTFATADHTYLTFCTTNSGELVKFGRQVEFSGAYTLPVADGTAGQALITDGSGSVGFTTISTEIDIAGDSGTDTVSLVNDTLTFTGGEGINTAVTNNIVTVSAELATSSNLGVAKFSTDNFAVTTGLVTIKNGGVANAELVNSSITVGTTAVALGSSSTTLSGLTQVNVDNLRLDGNTLSTTDSNGDLNLSPNGSGVVNVNTSKIINVSTPTAATDAANKGYVDAVKQALDIKESVRVATTANIVIASSLNNGDTIDGVTLVNGDRVLVKNQTTGSQNGIYVVGAVPARSLDADTSTDVTSGMFCFVEEGTLGGDQGFVLTTNDTITINTTALTFVQFSGAGQITAGDGIIKSGNTLHANDDDITIEVSSDALRIKGIAATAIGDLLIGAAGNAGYTRLVKPTANDSLLTMGTNGAASWTVTLDGGTF